MKAGQKHIKIIGGGLVGVEIAYILARNGFVVHIFDKEQPSMCEIEKNIPFKTEMQEELIAWNSPSYLTAKRLGVSLENIKHDFVEMMKEKLKSFSNVSFVEAEIDEINLDELTLISTGNNTTTPLIDNLTKYIGENKIAFFHPEPMLIDNIDLNHLHHEHEDFYHVNLSEEEYNAVCEYLKRHRAFYNNNSLVNEISLEKRAECNSLRTFLRPIYSENSKSHASIRLKKQGDDFILLDFYSALSDGEQTELIKHISAFENAMIKRFSKLYKRTYLRSTMCLNEYMQVKNHPNLFFAGSFLGIGGVYENLLVANYVAYNLMNASLGRNLEEYPKNSITKLICEKLLQKSALNNMLLSLDYDIIKKSDCLNFKTDEILKFREKYHGKFLEKGCRS